MSGKRIYELDGLKGIAVLSVILSHIPISHIYTDLPSFFQPFLTILFRSGGLAVFILFLLTGFLMAFLYPYPVPAIAFLEKRYLRLLPPFFAMVITFTMIHLVTVPFWAEIVLALFTIVLIRVIWEIANFFSVRFSVGKILFFLWLTFQISTAVWYIFYLLRVPPAVFYQVWNPALGWVITGVINITMTLPFGQYIAQLDGVYWALIAEVFFYFIYPAVIAPIVSSIGKCTSIRLKICLMISLFPFCFGLLLIAQRILRLSIVQPHLIIYFIFGVVIGGYYRQVQQGKKSVLKIFSNKALLILSLLAIFGYSFIAKNIPSQYYPWLQISEVIPLSIIVLFLVGPKTKVHNVLTRSRLVWIGGISYSLFITHSFVIHVFLKIYHSQSVVGELFALILISTGSFSLAWFLNLLLEKPYMQRKKSSKVKVSSMQLLENKIRVVDMRKISMKITGSLIVFLLLLLYIAYKPPVSFFTIVNRESPSSIWEALQREKTNILSPDVKTISFQGTNTNLGMIFLHLRNHPVEGGVDTQSDVVKLSIRLKDEKNTIISTHIYPTSEIIDSAYHPFGFPIENNSYGKKYFLEVNLSRKSPSQQIELVTTESQVLTVYFPQKKELMENKMKLVRWVFLKISEPFSNPLLWGTCLLISPFFISLLSIFLLSRKRFFPSK